MGPTDKSVKSRSASPLERSALVPGRTKNRRGDGARLHEELIDAAVAILEDGGTEADLSIRAVTRQAGVAPQSFYLHFADRDELLWAVYASEFEELEVALTAAARRATTPVEKLRIRTQAYGRYAQRHPAKYRVLFGLLSSYGAGSKNGSLPSDISFAAWRDLITECVEAGHARQADPDLLTITLLGAIHGLVLLRLNKPGRAWPPLKDLYADVLSHQIGLT